jgi:hypothetical protein
MNVIINFKRSYVSLEELFLVVLEVELWASYLLGRLFALVIFQIGFCFMPRLTLTAILLFVLPNVAGMIGATQHSQPLVEMGSCKLFC